MTKYYNDTKYAGYSGFGKKPHNNRGRTFLKVMLWTIGSLGCLLLAAWIVVLCYFTPTRISNLVKKEAAQYVDGDLEIGKIHYKLFSTFPELYITIDTLSIISKSLDGLSEEERSKLPPNADFLASAGKVHLGINIRKLMKNEIALKDVEIDYPSANIVIVNDSVNNYNIFPSLPASKDMKMPRFSLKNVEIKGPVKLSFTDIAQDLSLDLALDRLLLEKEADKGYVLDLGVEAKGKYAGISPAVTLKADISGKVDFSSNLFPSGKASNDSGIPNFMALQAEGLKVDFGDVAFTSDFDVAMNDSTLFVRSLAANVASPDILSLTRYIPADKVQMPAFMEDLAGKISINLSVKLAQPWQSSLEKPEIFTLEMLPQLLAEVSAGGNILYQATPKEAVDIENMDFHAQLFFNPQNLQESYCNIDRIKFNSQGVDIGGNLKLKSEDDMPEVVGSFELDTYIEKSFGPLLAKNGIGSTGKIIGDITFSFEVAGLSGEVERLEEMNLLSIGKEDFAGLPGYLSIRNLNASTEVKGRGLKVNSRSAGLSSTFKNLDIKFDGNIPSLAFSGTPKGNFSLLLIDPEASVVSKGVSTTLSGLKLKVDVNNITPPKGSTIGCDLDLGVKAIGLSSAGTSLSMADLSTRLSGSLLSSPKSFTANCDTIPANKDEEILRSRLTMTPMYLVPSPPGVLAAVMTMADVDLEMKIGAGRLSTSYYLATNLFSDLDISTDLDRIDIKSLTAASDNSQVSLNGFIEGLGAFLVSGSPSILKADLNADFTNCDINRLSGAYYAAVEKATGKPYDFTVPPQGPYTKADSICVLIPRNLQGIVRLRAQSAEYMGYRFSPLSTNIILNNGDATLSRLTIGAPYVTVAVDWTYATSDLNDIYMSLDADVDDFDFSKFFLSFPELTDKAPEIRNLTGSISATTSGRFNMFPSMFLNAPSMEAKFNVTSDDIEFARQGKIEKITHLMMIKGDAPIRLHNLDINGSFHDNLLMLNPFHLVFDNYQLGVAGVNNLQGGMYYHLALEKSPFHVPFAVNLVGKYPNPEVRLGGTEVKDGRERIISADLQDNVDINIMTWLHRGWIMFIQEAAKYDLKKQGR